MKLISKFREKIEERKAICNACEHKKQNSINISVCGLCGCPINSKTLMPNSTCADTPPKW